MKRGGHYRVQVYPFCAKGQKLREVLLLYLHHFQFAVGYGFYYLKGLPLIRRNIWHVVGLVGLVFIWRHFSEVLRFVVNSCQVLSFVVDLGEVGGDVLRQVLGVVVNFCEVLGFVVNLGEVGGDVLRLVVNLCQVLREVLRAVVDFCEIGEGIGQDARIFAGISCWIGDGRKCAWVGLLGRVEPYAGDAAAFAREADRLGFLKKRPGENPALQPLYVCRSACGDCLVVAGFCFLRGLTIGFLFGCRLCLLCLFFIRRSLCLLRRLCRGFRLCLAHCKLLRSAAFLGLDQNAHSLVFFKLLQKLVGYLKLLAIAKRDYR